jgi:hypothetical protein
MLEITSMGSVLRGLGFLYWLLAIGAISLALAKGKTPRAKALWTTIAAVVFGFLPVQAMLEQHKRDAYAKEAWAYFNKLCAEKSGEKIYKSYTGVKSVLVVKPLPPATEKDLFDQFWYGDPYSDASTYKRAESAARHLVMYWKHRSGVGIQKGLDFVEIKNDSGNGYIQIQSPRSPQLGTTTELIQQAVSKFGLIWEDISTPNDRRYWIAGSRLQVVNLTDNSVVAERIGYLIESGFGSTSGQRRPWQTARGIGPNGQSCPDSHDATDQWFITTVFKQESENKYVKSSNR